MDMTQAEIKALARAYCRKYQSEETANGGDHEVSRQVFRLVEENPKLGLSFLVHALQEHPSECAFANLAACPMEDLLAFHGPEVIAEVEQEAERNPAFDHLLGGVFLGRLAPEVAARVATARNAKRHA